MLALRSLNREAIKPSSVVVTMSEQPQDNISTALKVPPQSIEAERSVLGGLMLDDQSWFDLVELIKPSDFYRTQHQIIFEAMIVIANKDQPLDAVTLSEELQNQGQLENTRIYSQVHNLVCLLPH